MGKLKSSIIWKVIFLILVLVTFTVVSIGVYSLWTQARQLESDMIRNITRDAESFGFVSARSVLVGDDLSMLENLQMMSRIPGYVYGQVVSAGDKSSLVKRVNPKYEEDYIEKALQESLENFWKGEFKAENAKVSLQKLSDFPGALTLYVFYYPFFHPFAADKRFLGVVQIVHSNEVINERTRSSARNLTISMVLFWVLAGLGAAFLARLIVKPINVLAKGARIVGEGNLDYKVPVISEDELGALARQFNRMTEGLKSAQQAKEEQLVLDEQIRQATEIQEGMNPMELLDTDFFQVKGFTRAAKGVGGDYFDFQILPDGRLALLISDVSGKSISASLVMVLIKTVFSTYLELFRTVRPDTILSTVNKVMASQAHIDKFATMIFLIFDPEKKSIEFTNGGQGPLFLYRAAGGVCTLSKLPGLPVGIDDDNEYSIARIQAQPGDMVVLYTDGITEAYNKTKEQFDISGLRKRIIDYADRGVEEMVGQIIEDIDEFSIGTEQHDDMTLVILKIK